MQYPKHVNHRRSNYTTGYIAYKMKMEHNPATPKEEIPSQLQNPLERRRLQNRLSQRNHRKTFPQQYVWKSQDNNI
jgi:hypothetical protein